MHNTTEILLKPAGSPQDTAELICVSSHYISDIHSFIHLQSWKLWSSVGFLPILFLFQAGVWHMNTDAQTILLVCATQFSDIVFVMKFQHLLSAIPLKNKAISLYHLTQLVWITESCNKQVSLRFSKGSQLTAFAGGISVAAMHQFRTCLIKNQGGECSKALRHQV